MDFKGKVVSVIGAGLIMLSSITGVAAQNSSTASVDIVVRASGNGGLSITKVEQTGAFQEVTTHFDSANQTTGSIKVTLEDNRFTRQGWQLSVSASDLKGTTNQNNTIPVGNFTIQNAQVDRLAGDQAPQSQANNVALTTQGTTLTTASRGSGSGHYAVTMNGTLTVPANTPADTYKTTVTFSLVTAP